jgi:hypothetical protein
MADGKIRPSHMGLKLRRDENRVTLPIPFSHIADWKNDDNGSFVLFFADAPFLDTSIPFSLYWPKGLNVYQLGQLFIPFMEGQHGN